MKERYSMRNGSTRGMKARIGMFKRSNKSLISRRRSYLKQKHVKLMMIPGCYYRYLKAINTRDKSNKPLTYQCSYIFNLYQIRPLT